MPANHAPGPSDSPQGDADYQTLLAALMGTARGRSFLEQHARRSRALETESLLAAIARIEGLLTSRGLEPAAPPEDLNAEHARAAAEPPVDEAVVEEIGMTGAATIAAAPTGQAATFEATPIDATAVDDSDIVFVPGDAIGFEPEQPRGRPAPRAGDPFADIHALSQAEKIALFT